MMFTTSTMEKIERAVGTAIIGVVGVLALVVAYNVARWMGWI